MSISQRKFRALVLEYHDAGTTGQVDSTYLVKPSPDADLHWWCSRIPTSGHETTIGMKADHRVDADFGFAAEVPIAVNDVIVCNSQSFAVRAVLERDYQGMAEWQVRVERVVEQALST